MNKKLAEARDLLEAALFHSEVDRLLQDALRARYPGSYCWVQDVSDIEVVYEVTPKSPTEADGTTYRTTYAIDDQQQVTIGEPVQVERKTTYVPVGAASTTEAEDFTTGGEFVALVEKAVRKDGTMAVKVIQPGVGTSGFYPAGVLERDGPKVFAKGTRIFVDHPTATEEADRPERSVRDLAGEFVSDARWETQGAAGPGLYADAKVFGPWQPFVEELAPHIGMSIRAQGRGTMGEVDGEPMRIIKELVSAQSVDLVTAAGAGGQILSLFESARNRAAVEFAPTYLEADTDMANEQELKEARDALAAKEAEVATLTEANDQKDLELTRLHEMRLFNESHSFVAQALAGVEMPELTRARLTESLSTRPVIKDGVLDTDGMTAAVESAVKAEIEYLAKVIGSGRVTGMGDDGDIAVAETAAALAATFQGLGLSEAEAKTAVRGR